jgi:large subunit ribosomal protein L25
VAENVLQVELRENGGKGVARKLRQSGRIPGVLYGRGKRAQPVTLDPKPLERALQRSEAGMNTLFDLHVSGGSGGDRVVLVKELQREPARGTPLHADLYEVDLTETVEVEVPIHLVGTPPGVSLEGGIMDHAHRALAVECLPRAIPDELSLDVSGLNIGDSLHVSDIALPEGVELRDDPEISVVSVVAPRVEEEAAPAEGEEVVEAEGAEEAAPSEAAEGGESAEGEEKGD